jgi:BASS family bile acid:Na+ symporter
VKPGFLRTTAILSSLLVGALVPQGASLAWLIRWLIMGMLYIVFLQTSLSRQGLQRSHVWLVAANVGMGFLGWGIGWLIGGQTLALAGFFCGITPTATAAPVIVSFLKGRVDYVVAAFVLTNIIVSALFPALVPLFVGNATPGLFANVAQSVLLVIFGPMLLAWLTRVVFPGSTAWPKRLSNVSFGAWVLALFLITSRVSSFLHEHSELPRSVVAEMGLLALILCVLNFSLGRFLGGKQFAREASQSLGQKNTTLTIYLALTYASPLVALGPTCYVLWHNLWNSWQLHRHSQAEQKSSAA